MIVIPAGAFLMGSPGSEAGRFENEGPQHLVAIPHAFAMGVTDVTRGEYRRFVKATHRTPTKDCRIFDGKNLIRLSGRSWTTPNFSQTDRDPVVCISWNDVHAYIDWLNNQMRKHAPKRGSSTGTGSYRLPSEAEWEYAARAGTTSAYYWGSAIRRRDANYGPDQPIFAPKALGADHWEYTSPGGAFPANPFGLFDMAGNVWQFVEDCWRADYVGAPSDASARFDGKCDEHVVRGGSWFKPPTGERAAKRGEAKAVDLDGSNEIGFRVVRDLAAR
jgi:formylglycine-generating enzyme required for sulfatase activity